MAQKKRGKKSDTKSSFFDRLNITIFGDRVLLILTFALMLFSVFIVYSSSAKMAYDVGAIRSTSEFLWSQIIYLVFATAVFLVVYIIDIEDLRSWIPAFFVLTLGVTLYTSFFGQSTNGAARWLSIFGFQVQPSEALKVMTMLMLAYSLDYISSDDNIFKERIHIDRLQLFPNFGLFNFISRPNYDTRHPYVGFIFVILPIIFACVGVIKAHTSSAIIIFVASLMVLYMGRVKIFELFRLIFLTVCAFFAFVAMGLGRSSTFMSRFDIWQEIWTTDRTEVLVENLYDTDRAMIAMYNGGFTGLGAGQSIMRAEMIHPESDYAFAFLTEEWGSITAILLLITYLLLFFRTVKIFQGCSTQYSRIAVLGLGAMIILQALAHIAVSINLSPETGLTLPLISRGGSALIASAFSLGVMLSISRTNEMNLRKREQERSAQ